MSEMETVRGTMRLVDYGLNLEDTCKQVCEDNGVTELSSYCNSFTQQLQEDMYDNFIVANGKLYEILEINHLDSFGFSEVIPKENGDIDFFCHWYNGGASLNEVIEGALNES